MDGGATGMEARQESEAEGLAEALRRRTAALHRTAERSGIFRDLLRGAASLPGYGLLLRNLLPVYEALERGLEGHREDPVLAGIAEPALYRTAALASDLERLGASALPLLPEGSAYAARIEACGQADPALLLSHAYTRYLGDLSGGQILRRLLGGSLGLEDSALAFYAFPAIADPEAFKERFRAALDAAGRQLDSPARGEVVEEGARAFELNIALSEAVQHRA